MGKQVRAKAALAACCFRQASLPQVPSLFLLATFVASFLHAPWLQFQQQLLATGKRSLRGLDAALLCGSTLQDRADFLTTNCVGGLSDTVGVSSVSGGIFDLSFAGKQGNCRAASCSLPCAVSFWSGGGQFADQL